MKMNERLKIINTVSEIIKQYETIPHKTNDSTYYDALYKLHQAETAVITDANNYLKEK